MVHTKKNKAKGDNRRCSENLQTQILGQKSKKLNE